MAPATQSRFSRYFIPGLVMRSVLVGATYSTGREVTEFFLKYGAFSGVVGVIVSTALFSGFCMVALELARRYQVLDYKSFSRVYMGRLWFLYEFGFLAGVMLTLSTIAAASAEIGGALFDLPDLVVSITLMSAIALLVYLGSNWLEKVMAVWSMFFYGCYAILLGITLYNHGADILAALKPTAISWEALGSAVVYAGFSCAILPVIIFVARHTETRRDAIIAGGLSGPLVFAPGLALALILIPFLPKIVDEPVPIINVLDGFGTGWLAALIKVAILGELALNGAGLLHGVNERIAKEVEDHKGRLPWIVRPLLAVGAIVFSIYLAEAVGLINLVKLGLRYGAIFFLIIMVLPLLTRGLWMLMPKKAAS
jgi:uncharacterized membrane protein YkvI